MSIVLLAVLRCALQLAPVTGLHAPVTLHGERSNIQYAALAVEPRGAALIDIAQLARAADANVEEVEDHPESIVTLRNSSGMTYNDHLLISQPISPEVTLYQNPWETIYKASRHNWHDDYAKKGSPEQFFQAAHFRDWVVFLGSLPFLFMLQIYMSKRTRAIRHHVYALLVWLVIGAMALLYIHCSIGGTEAIHWTTGYILEFIFTIENVFVFHMVLHGFKADKPATKTALFYVVVFQMLCGAVFYMGLAHTLRSMDFLPYVLGLWLLYVGICSIFEDGHDEIDAESTAVYKFVDWLLGETLSPEYAEGGAVFFTKNGKTCISMVGPLIVCLLIVDFMLEIDVTLTKIEELDNEYVAFTSSAIAAFAMPEIYFVAQDLFKRYSLLKYGLSFVIIFFGMQMVCHRFFSIPDLLGCAIMVGAMLLCILLSACFGYGSTPDYAETPKEDSRIPQK